MANTYIFDKISEFKDKFAHFFQHRKKIKSLENFSEVAYLPQKHRVQISMIKQCLDDHFLEEEEERFLSWMLNKYELNYLDWSHKTKWLKNRMREIASTSKIAENQLFFDYDRNRAAAHLSFETVLEQNKTVNRNLNV